MAEAMTLRDWIDVVRRIRLGASTKVVALALTTYADPDGSRVFPGVARLAYVCELSPTTVKSALSKLRKAGLIVKAGRRGDADAYRLVLAEDLLERVKVPAPDEVDAELARIRAVYKGTYSPGLRTGTRSADSDGHDDVRTGVRSADSHDPEESADGYTTSSMESADRLTDSLRTGTRSATFHDQSRKNTIQNSEDHSAQVLVPGESPLDEDPISPPADLVKRPRCPHGRSARRHTDGRLRCETCRADEEVALKRGTP